MKLFRCAAVLAVIAAVTPVRAQDQESLEEFLKRIRGGVKVEVETDHFAITCHAGKQPAEEYQKFSEALFALWKQKLGQAAEPVEKLRVEIFVDEDDYHKAAPKGSTYHLKDGCLLLLHGRGSFNIFAAGGTELYLGACYPDMMSRDDLPPWLVPGLTQYFGTANWRDGRVEIDTVQIPEASLNARSLKELKTNDWVPFKKGLLGGGSEYAKAKRIVDLQAWAVFYWFFNAPGQEGGKGQHVSAVPDLLDALNSAEKTGAAVKSLAGRAGADTLGALDGKVKRYVRKLKAEIPDRAEGDWLVGETVHYTIRVQKGAENKKLRWNDDRILKDMKFKMELLFEKYALAFGFKGKLTQKASMRLYKDRDEYYRHGGPQGSAAYYSPRTKELVGYEDSATTGIVFQIFCHEGCHQFFDLAFPGFYKSEDLPMWFSEGLADCFGSSEIRGKSLYVFTLSGVATWRMETVKEAIQEGLHTPLRELIGQGRRPFMMKAGLHYAQAWSFCHFLWNAPSLNKGNGTYREVLIRLIEGFSQGKPRDEVYKEAFRHKGRKLDIDVLEEQWKDYVRKFKVKTTRRR